MTEPEALAALQRATGCSPAATWADIIAVVTELNANASEFGKRLRERAAPTDYTGIGELAAKATKRGGIRKLAAAIEPFVSSGNSVKIAEGIARARRELHADRTDE